MISANDHFGNTLFKSSSGYKSCADTKGPSNAQSPTSCCLSQALPGSVAKMTDIEDQTSAHCDFVERPLSSVCEWLLAFMLSLVTLQLTASYNHGRFVDLDISMVELLWFTEEELRDAPDAEAGAEAGTPEPPAGHSWHAHGGSASIL